MGRGRRTGGVRFRETRGARALFDQLNPEDGPVGRPTANARPDRAGRDEVHELADEARRRAVPRITDTSVIAVDVGALELERGQLRDPIPLVAPVAADVGAAVGGRDADLRSVWVGSARQIEVREQDDPTGIGIEGVLDPGRVHVACRGHVLPGRHGHRRIVRLEDRVDELGGSASRRGPVEPADVTGVVLAEWHDGPSIGRPGDAGPSRIAVAVAGDDRHGRGHRKHETSRARGASAALEQASHGGRIRADGHLAHPDGPRHEGPEGLARIDLDAGDWADDPARAIRVGVVVRRQDARSDHGRVSRSGGLRSIWPEIRAADIDVVRGRRGHGVLRRRVRDGRGGRPIPTGHRRGLAGIHRSEDDRAGLGR